MYSVDFRKKVLAIRTQENLSIREVATRFKLSRDTVFRWTKTVEPKTWRAKRANKIDRELLRRDVEHYPDSYAYERANRLGVSCSGIRHVLKCLGVTYQKKPSTGQSGSRKAFYLLPHDT
jgi:transposase